LSTLIAKEGLIKLFDYFRIYYFCLATTLDIYCFLNCHTHQIRVIASVTSSTHAIKSKTVIFMDKGKIYLQLNQFTKPVWFMYSIVLLMSFSTLCINSFWNTSLC